MLIEETLFMSWWWSKYHQRSIWLGQFIFHNLKKIYSIISPKKCCITKDVCSQKLRQFQAKKGISYFLCVLYYIYFRILCWWRPASYDINFYRNWPKSSYVILEMIIFFLLKLFFSIITFTYYFSATIWYRMEIWFCQTY